MSTNSNVFTRYKLTKVIKIKTFDDSKIICKSQTNKFKTMINLIIRHKFTKVSFSSKAQNEIRLYELMQRI